MSRIRLHEMHPGRGEPFDVRCLKEVAPGFRDLGIHHDRRGASPLIISQDDDEVWLWRCSICGAGKCRCAKPGENQRKSVYSAVSHTAEVSELRAMLNR